MAKEPPNPLTLVEQQYTLAEVQNLLRMGEGELRAQVNLFIKTGGRDGIGPVFKYNSKTVVLNASAILHFQARHRVDMAM